MAYFIILTLRIRRLRLWKVTALAHGQSEHVGEVGLNSSWCVPTHCSQGLTHIVPSAPEAVANSGSCWLHTGGRGTAQRGANAGWVGHEDFAEEGITERF